MVILQDLLQESDIGVGVYVSCIYMVQQSWQDDTLVINPTKIIISILDSFIFSYRAKLQVELLLHLFE